LFKTNTIIIVAYEEIYCCQAIRRLLKTAISIEIRLTKEQQLFTHWTCK